MVRRGEKGEQGETEGREVQGTRKGRERKARLRPTVVCLANKNNNRNNNHNDNSNDNNNKWSTWIAHACA
jgi:hypothetical protein